MNEIELDFKILNKHHNNEIESILCYSIQEKEDKKRINKFSLSIQYQHQLFDYFIQPKHQHNQQLYQ